MFLTVPSLIAVAFHTSGVVLVEGRQDVRVEIDLLKPVFFTMFR
jgi:hypothetical protein